MPASVFACRRCNHRKRIGLRAGAAPANQGSAAGIGYFAGSRPIGMFAAAGTGGMKPRVNVEPSGPVRTIGRCVVGLRDAGHDRQSEPGAGHPACGRCPVEAFEDVREVLVWNPGPVIGDRHVRVVDDDAYRDVGWIPLDRIVDQVADGVVDPGGIDVHQARFAGPPRWPRAACAGARRCTASLVSRSRRTVSRCGVDSW